MLFSQVLCLLCRVTWSGSHVYRAGHIISHPPDGTETEPGSCFFVFASGSSGAIHQIEMPARSRSRAKTRIYRHSSIEKHKRVAISLVDWRKQIGAYATHCTVVNKSDSEPELEPRRWLCGARRWLFGKRQDRDKAESTLEHHHDRGQT